MFLMSGPSLEKQTHLRNAYPFMANVRQAAKKAFSKAGKIQCDTPDAKKVFMELAERITNKAGVLNPDVTAQTDIPAGCCFQIDFNDVKGADLVRTVQPITMPMYLGNLAIPFATNPLIPVTGYSCSQC